MTTFNRKINPSPKLVKAVKRSLAKLDELVIDTPAGYGRSEYPMVWLRRPAK